jgi:hypothetical protein
VAGGWREQHNEELEICYASPDIINVIKPKEEEMSGHVVRMGEMMNTYIILGGEEKKISLGRPRHRWEDNINVDLTLIGWEGVNRIHVAQDRAW